MPHTPHDIIMNILLNDPSFTHDKIVLTKKLQITDQQLAQCSYHQMIQFAANLTNAAQAIAIIELFEKIIMHYYHYQTYLYGSYSPWRSIIFTGIQSPACWCSNDLLLDQLMQELTLLADIAQQHSYITAQRLRLTAISYLYWKRIMLLAITGYLSADLFSRGWENSSLKDIYAKGLVRQSPVLLQKLYENITDASNFILWSITSTAHITYKILSPIITFIVLGVEGLEANSQQTIGTTEQPN